MKEMLLKEAAQRNPDAASVLSGNSANIDTVQRAVAMAQAYNAPPSRFGGPPAARGGGSSSSSGTTRNPAATTGGGKPSQSEKVFLELHIGGLPDSITDEVAFAGFLNENLLSKGLTSGEPGNPILATRITTVGHYAFAQFRSKEECTLGLKLNGTLCMGNQLRVERPKGYQGAVGGVILPGGGQSAVAALDEHQLITAATMAVPLPKTLPKADLKRMLEVELKNLGQSTDVVEVRNVYDGTLDDVKMEAKRYGNLSDVRPTNDPSVYLIRMSNIYEAEQFVQAKRVFKDRPVTLRFASFGEWEAVDPAKQYAN